MFAVGEVDHGAILCRLSFVACELMCNWLVGYNVKLVTEYAVLQRRHACSFICAKFADFSSLFVCTSESAMNFDLAVATVVNSQVTTKTDIVILS